MNGGSLLSIRQPCMEVLRVNLTTMHGDALSRLACRMTKIFTEKVAPSADKKVGHSMVKADHFT